MQSASAMSRFCVVATPIAVFGRQSLAVSPLIIQLLYTTLFITSCVIFRLPCVSVDRLCGLVVRVSGYRYRGLGFDSRRYQIF